MEEEKKEFDLFEKKDSKKEEKKFVSAQKKLTKGIVAGINKEKGYILVDNAGNGERTPYLEGRHAQLKIGDPIEF